MLIDTTGWGLTEVTYPDGAVILQEGRHHRELLVLTSGEVSVRSQGAEISRIDEPGSLFGEMAFLLDGAATATVVAVGECRFRRTDDPDLLLERHPELALQIAVVLAGRLDRATRHLTELRQERDGDRSAFVDAALGALIHGSGTPTA